MNIFIYYLYGAINVLGTLQSNKRQQPCHQDLATWEMRAGLLHLNDQGWIAGGEDETYRIKKKYSSPPPRPPPPFHCLWLMTVTFEVICIHIYSINIWQVVSSQAFLLHLVERSPASRRPLAGQGQTSPESWWPSRLACSGVPAPVPQDSQRSDTAFIPLLSSACRWEAAFCRRLNEGIISHLWDGAGMPQLPCLECPPFCFASQPTEVLKKLH